MTWGVLIILLGLLLLFAEMVVPSGFMFILSITLVIAGVVMIFYAPESEGGGKTPGLIAVGLLVVVLPTIIGVLFRYIPHTPLGKRFFLPTAPIEETNVVATMTEVAELEQYHGLIGRTVTPHQPS